MEKLIELFSEFSAGLFVIHTALFLVLLFFLKKFAWKPILNAVEEREESIEEAIMQAKKARDEMANLKAENERTLKEARIERDQILKEARDMKEKIISDAKESAKKEGNKMIEIAKQAIQNEKMAAMVELKNQIAHLSLDMAEKVINHELSDKATEENMVKEMIDKVTLN